MTQVRRYYSQRLGINANTRLDLPTLRRLFAAVFERLADQDYFQQAFGYSCPDSGQVPGTLGPDVGAALFLKLRKDHLWPITSKLPGYSEDDLFDVVEFLFDVVSKPSNGYYHDYCSSWHYSKFNPAVGRDAFRTDINVLLTDYSDGFELSEDGEVLSLAPQGMQQLVSQPIPELAGFDGHARIEAAVRKFRRHGVSQSDKRDAVRDLADILEYLRPDLDGVISSKDESDLFNLANNYTVRHYNKGQKSQYDEAIWLTWMFYTYLAMLHVVSRLLSRGPSRASERPASGQD